MPSKPNMQATDQTSIARFFSGKINVVKVRRLIARFASSIPAQQKIVEILLKSRNLKQYSYFEKEHKEHKKPGAMGSWKNI